MSAVETMKAAYAALGRNDPSGLFGAMDAGIEWNEAEQTAVASTEEAGEDADKVGNVLPH